jgi:hypothetical protein
VSPSQSGSPGGALKGEGAGFSISTECGKQVAWRKQPPPTSPELAAGLNRGLVPPTSKEAPKPQEVSAHH